MWQYNIEDRITAVSNFIMIANLLIKMNNFNTSFAILAGLQLSAIYRLKLIERLSKGKQKLFSDLVFFFIFFYFFNIF